MNQKTLQRYISNLRDGKAAPELGAFRAGMLTRFIEKPDAPYVVKWFGAEDKAAKCLFVEIVICMSFPRNFVFQEMGYNAP